MKIGKDVAIIAHTLRVKYFPYFQVRRRNREYLFVDAALRLFTVRSEHHLDWKTAFDRLKVGRSPRGLSPLLAVRAVQQLLFGRRLRHALDSSLPRGVKTGGFPYWNCSQYIFKSIVIAITLKVNYIPSIVLRVGR